MDFTRIVRGTVLWPILSRKLDLFFGFCERDSTQYSSQFAAVMNPFTFGLFNSYDLKAAAVNRNSLEPTESSPVVCRRPGMRWKMAGRLITPIEHPSEAFECLDCFLVDTLNEHGRCARCGSNAVMQYMVLEKTDRWIKVGGAPYWVSTEQPQMKAAESAPRISEQPRHCRTIARRNTPKPARAPVMRKRYA
jgi:hypothetical protein